MQRRTAIILSSVSVLILLSFSLLYLKYGLRFSNLPEQALEGFVGRDDDPNQQGRTFTSNAAAVEELARSGTEHWNIAVRVSRCFPGLDMARHSKLSGNVDMALLIGTRTTGVQSWGETQEHDKILEINNFQRALLVLSQSMELARSQLAASAADSHFIMVFFQWSVVVIGAMTTILVSIKSIDKGDGRYYFIVGILAVVFSAAGTAVSSMSSFISPSESYVKSERALVQLRQLHNELMMFALQEKDSDLCTEFDPDKSEDRRVKKILGFSSRLNETIISTGMGNNGAIGNNMVPVPGTSSLPVQLKGPS